MTNPTIFSGLNGSKHWLNEKKEHHREDGPAYESVCGHKEWFRDGLRHRVDGPAIEYSEETKLLLLNMYKLENNYYEWNGLPTRWYVGNQPVDILGILERFDISHDWKTWTDEEKFLVRLALP